MTVAILVKQGDFDACLKIIPDILEAFIVRKHSISESVTSYSTFEPYLEPDRMSGCVDGPDS